MPSPPCQSSVIVLRAQCNGLTQVAVQILRLKFTCGTRDGGPIVWIEPQDVSPRALRALRRALAGQTLWFMFLGFTGFLWHSGAKLLPAMRKGGTFRSVSGVSSVFCTYAHRMVPAVI